MVLRTTAPRQGPLTCTSVVIGAGVIAVVLGASGCSVDGGGDAGASAAVTSPTVERDLALQAELVRMGEEDQAERMGNPELPPGTRLGPPQDGARTARLKEIVAEHGWPTYDLVGEDGASAAWLVAQHADFDVAFQQEARDLLAAAVADGQGDPTELAYLEDRVAVNLDEPQRYGTQVRCREGAPAPASPLVDEARVDALREEVGLGALEEYYDELAMMCANEEMEGQGPP